MVIALPLLLLLADESSLSRLERWAASAIDNNAKTIVVTTTGETRKGRFLAWSETEVVLNSSDGARSIPRECVAIVRTADSFGYHTVYAPWSNLVLLGYKYPIQVIRDDLTLMEGTLVSVGENHLVLRYFKEEARIPRDKIKKVRALRKTQAEMGANIGAGIGLVAIFAAIAASGGDAPQGSIDPVLAAGALGPGTVGRGIGSLFREYQTIYIAPRK